MTARWVVDEVAPARDIHVIWQPISLQFKNDVKEDNERFGYIHATHRMLRVMEGVRAAEGDDAVGPVYWQFATRIHHDQQLEFDLAEALTEAGADPSHAAAADDEAWDKEIRTRMDEGLALCGDDVGTPMLAFEDKFGVKQGYFGPVITRVPPTEDSLAMFDALVTMMDVQGFWELKRTRTERPEFGDRPESGPRP